jgi:L-threonylcarbamoyladenylate synthase
MHEKSVRMISRKLTSENINTVLDQAIAILQRGGLIAYPTETFYGVGVKFDMRASLHRLYWLKRRPREKAMPVIIGDIGSLSEIVSPEWLGSISSSTQSLMERFWPGPLTLLVPARAGLSEHLTAETGMIAVRIPGESFALRLATRAGFPITATSANISGMPPAESAEMVIQYFEDSLDLLIDGGRTAGTLPSTIVDASGDRIKIVREGIVRTSDLFQENRNNPYRT